MLFCGKRGRWAGFVFQRKRPKVFGVMETASEVFIPVLIASAKMLMAL